jgi:flagellin
LIQTAEGATGTITDMLQRMRELAIQAMNDTNAQDQRGYLDLEFQQLKQQIVTISEHTQWNGFSILNGSVGERVGDRPVYRVTSQPAFYSDPKPQLNGIQAGDMIINGRTIRSAVPLDGSIKGVGEPFPQVSSQGSAIAIAKAINEATNLTGVSAVVNTNVMQGTSMNGEVASGYLVINGFRTGDIESLFKNPRVTREEIVKEINVISAQTGVIAIDTDSDKLGIRLEAKDGRNISVELKPASGSVSNFSAAIGIREGLQVGTYSLETTVTGRLDIESTGDWTRSGIPPAVGTDKFNYSQNISIAQTGLRGFVDSTPPTLTGGFLNKTADVPGVVTPVDNTTPSNVSFSSTTANISEGDKIVFTFDGKSYTAVVGPFGAGAGAGVAAVSAALAAAKDSTGTPLGTGLLTAADSSGALVLNAATTAKSITAATYTNFAAIASGTATVGTTASGAILTFTGAKTSLTQGDEFAFAFNGQTFNAKLGAVGADDTSLLNAVQSAVNTALNGSTQLGEGKITASFSGNNLVLTTALGDRPVPLQRGDLVINGIEIRGALDTDDKSSYAGGASNSRLASAIAIAAAINASSEETGVRAVANPLTISGRTIDTTGLVNNTTYSLYINGTQVDVQYKNEGNETWLAKIANAINTQAAHIQVSAAAGKNGLNITATDGRNLSVWFAESATVTSKSFGLADTNGISNVAGVTGTSSSNANKNFTGASTVYGTVSLFSDNAFTVEPGDNGYTASSNFTKLGFNEGTFGGTVNEAESKMTPPRTGRLTFHVGASATQTIHIDFADYGAKGPITGDITGDVALSNTDARVNRIDNAESARAVLAKLDTALDKVNGNRAVMGAVMNRLDYIMENLSNVSMNTSASRSQIEDADYAKASTELARTQIMQQAATAVLAQANMDQQTVLKLLQ